MGNLFLMLVHENFSSMKMLICLFVLFPFLSRYRESTMVVNTIVTWFFVYFFEYMCDAFNALRLSVSWLYVSFFLFFCCQDLDGSMSLTALKKIFFCFRSSIVIDYVKERILRRNCGCWRWCKWKIRFTREHIIYSNLG